MTSRVEQRLLRGSIAAGAGMLFTVVQAVVQVPVLLGFWSPDVLSAWFLINAALALVVAASAGHQAYVAVEFWKRADAGPDTIRPELSAAVVGAALLAGVEFVVAALIVGAGRLHWLVAGEGALHGVPDVGAGFLTLVASACLINATVGVLIRLYPAGGLYARCQWIGNIHRACVFVALLASAAFGGRLLAAVLSAVTMNLLFAAFVWGDVRRRLPSLWPVQLGGAWSKAFQQIGASFVLTAITFIDHAVTLTLMAIVATARDAAGIATFATLRTAANLLQQASLVAVTPLMPEMSRYSAGGDSFRTVAAVSATWLVALAPAALCLTIVAPWMPQIYGGWTLGRLPFLASAFAGLATAVLLRQLALPIATMLNSANQLRAQGLLAVARAFTVIVVAYGFSRSDPFLGVGLGAAAGEAVAAAIAIGLLVQATAAERSFPLAACLLAIAQVVIALGVLLVLPWSPGTWLTAVVAHVVVAAAQWAALPTEVRHRMTSAVAGVLRVLPLGTSAQGTNG